SFVQGTINVPLQASPLLGGTGATFTITWASLPAPGYVFDVQIQRPGSNTFVDWMTSQTATSGTFKPDTGPGSYSFHSRIRNTLNGAASNYSGKLTITAARPGPGCWVCPGEGLGVSRIHGHMEHRSLGCREAH